MTSYGALSCSVLLLALTMGKGTASDNNAELARGAELLSPLKHDLKQALVAGLEKGPVHAITICRDQAPAIAGALSVDGVRVGRTSHRLRNPSNSAPVWIDSILETYLANEADRIPRLVSLDNDRLGYVEPILLQPLCLNCHGKALAPDVAARLKELYPGDQATGFDVGDLRGVYWAEYPVEK